MHSRSVTTAQVSYKFDTCQSQGGDDDVDALLSQFNLEEKAKIAAQIRENADPPSARTYASFTPHPTSVSSPDHGKVGMFEV